MTNKMAARVLTYKLRSPSYGDLKLENWKKIKKIVAWQSLSLVYGERVFRMQLRMVPFPAATNGE